MAIFSSSETLIAAAAAIAAGVSGWMFVGSWGTKGLPGCGTGSACDAVTRGRWSRWGRLPIAGIGSLFYILLAVAAITGFGRMQAFNGDVAVAGTMALIEEEKLLPESHRIRLRLKRSQESDTYCYSSEQVAAILQQCRATKLYWMGMVVLGLATTGMRIGELLQLRWSDVDLEGGIISLLDNRHSGRQRALGLARTTKGGRGRRIPIHRKLHAELNKLERHPSGRVFVGAMGGVLKADDIRTTLIRRVLAPLRNTFETAKGEIGFEHGRLHSFRHFFVSQAFVGGASEGEIREWVGHRDSRIVERYRHLGDQDARRKMDGIEFFADAAVDPKGKVAETAPKPAA